MLRGQFLGTSAGEGIPAPYCRCEVCNEARKMGIPYARMRSSFRLSDKIMLDMGADAPTQARMLGDFADIEHVIITHTHDDHLNAHMLMEAFWSRESRGTTHYWLTDKAYDIVDRWRDNSWILKGMVREYEEKKIVAFHRLEYGVPVAIDDVTVTPFKGNHCGNVGENSALYLIVLPDGRTLFYGLDSGPYLPETLKALKEYHIDIFISEATGGTRVLDDMGRQHMCLADVLKLSRTLFEQGTLSNTSTVYLSHINHATSHSQMEKAVEVMGFPASTIVAYDGLKIL